MAAKNKMTELKSAVKLLFSILKKNSKDVFTSIAVSLSGARLSK